MKNRLIQLSIFSLVLLFSVSITADEGMYPLSEISRLDLNSKGLKIDVSEIYNPEGVSLVDAICRVGGGTGEFVSEDGLILTNHHIAFSAVAAASTPEHDYLRDGFVAPERELELPAKNYTCLITEQYRDVTAEVMRAVREGMSPTERSSAIRDTMDVIAAREEAGRENITCDVSEMFPGKSYVLFTYRLIQDVRLVYVPPISIGEFGGDNDNWIWPRHTGDFSFMRAYVAPDGSTAPWSEDNVPFKPKKYIRVAPEGVREGDFVMVLGYPGRTYRHKTSHYVDLYEKKLMPWIVDLFDWMIGTMEETSRGDRARQLKFASTIKSFANVSKNFKGKIQGLRRLELVQDKRKEEERLQNHINSNPELRKKFAATLDDIGSVYDRYSGVLLQELTAGQLRRNGIVRIAGTLLGHLEQQEHTEENAERMRGFLRKQYEGLDVQVQKQFLARFLVEVSRLPENQRFASVGKLPEIQDERQVDREAAELVGEMMEESVLSSIDDLLDAMDESAADLIEDDPVIKLAADLRSVRKEISERRRVRDGELNRLEADLLDAKMNWKKTDFIPDANSTLRLTYGYIRGYAPVDATAYSPITTLRGVVEKYTGEYPYDAPARLLELYNNRKYDRRFEDSVLDEVPVAILYNMDTTGGNSGSPVLNAKGELVGVNFDRAYEATINDYRWSESYSRSIGVDIRYVLFIAKYLGGADFLMDELGVDR